MTMSNTVILNECLKEFKSQNALELADDEIFELFCGLEITKESDTDFSEIQSAIVDGGKDGGIDVFGVMINDKMVENEEDVQEVKFNERTKVNIVIIQSKISNSFAETVLDKLYMTLPLIFDLNLDENRLRERLNDSVVEKIQVFRQVWIESIRKRSEIAITFYYACKADTIVINDAFKSKQGQIENFIHEKISVARTEFKLLSSKELVELYNYRKPSSIELRFKEGPLPIPFTRSDYGYVGAVSLKDFYNFIKSEHGCIREEIFENNIRYFQGDVDVNKKIAKTLNQDEINDFWWLNNGITILCDDAPNLPKTLQVVNPQIVNGLQTSFSIFNNIETIAAPEKRSVLVKVILSKERETIDKIIEATNSQNAVPPVLLRATDDIQRMIEKYFLNEGYFYDRRKNFYKNQGKPVTRIFTIQDVAQSIEAILNKNPSTARRNPTTIIKSDERYKRIFSESYDYKVFLNSARIVRKVKLYISSSDKSKVDKNFLKNFSYHISLVLSAYQIGKGAFSEVDIANMDMNIESATIDKSIGKILEILKEYSDKTKENPINIAKSSAFDKELMAKIKLIGMSEKK